MITGPGCIKPASVHNRAFMAASCAIRGSSGPLGASLPLLLHVLDVREVDALGALARIAEIELVLAHEDGIAIDVVGDAGGVRDDKGFELLLVIGRYPARELEFRYLELARQ